METSFFASMLLHPVALGCLALVVLGATLVSAEKAMGAVRFTITQLLRGFFCVAIAALVVAAVAAYVPAEEAQRLGVKPENYQSVLLHQFVVLSTICTYAALLGCAFVGLPITLRLATRNLATTPLVVLASLPISLLASLALGLLSGIQMKHIGQAGLQFAAAHALLALGFSL